MIIYIYIESLWDVTLLLHNYVCDGQGENKIVRVGKNSGPVLSRLWTKVQEILRQRRRPLVLSNAQPWPWDSLALALAFE